MIKKRIHDQDKMWTTFPWVTAIIPNPLNLGVIRNKIVFQHLTVFEHLTLNASEF